MCALEKMARREAHIAREAADIAAADVRRKERRDAWLQDHQDALTNTQINEECEKLKATVKDLTRDRDHYKGLYLSCAAQLTQAQECNNHVYMSSAAEIARAKECMEQWRIEKSMLDKKVVLLAENEKRALAIADKAQAELRNTAEELRLAKEAVVVESEASQEARMNAAKLNVELRTKIYQNSTIEEVRIAQNR